MLLIVVGGAAEAFDLHDIRLLRDSGYRWCRGCDLSEANLQDADLSGAQLQDTNLFQAQLQGANLVRAQLQGAYLVAAQLESADLAGAQLQGATLRFAQLQGASLVGAQLQRAKLIRAHLQDADLRSAQLQDADLRSARLQGAKLALAYLQDAKLRSAQLQNADLRSAQLQNADLRSVQLQGANLVYAQLNGADLNRANVEGARLSHTNLTNAVYQPASPPPDSYVTGIQGLDTVAVMDTSGLVQLRELFQKAGHRDLEREATFSIERAKTHHALDRWTERPLRAAEAVARLIFFEWPVAYGLDPWRAFQILLGLMLLLSLIYVPAIGRTARSQRRRGAIYQIWPNERLIDDGDGIKIVTYGDVPERLRAHRLKAKSFIGQYCYALYFSLLSAFHIGWRELNVGTWLARLQPQEYTLRALGWPRVVSGLQSLISVYLVAIWALTYFGRPFQ